MQQLEWRDAKISDHSPRMVADSIFGTYEILRWSDGSFGGTIPDRMEFDDHSYIEFGNAVDMEQAREIAEYNYVTRYQARQSIPE